MPFHQTKLDVAQEGNLRHETISGPPWKHIPGRTRELETGQISAFATCPDLPVAHESLASI